MEMPRRLLLAVALLLVVAALAPSRSAAAERVFRDCDECPVLVVVPAGTFWMGSEEVLGAEPRHRVTIGAPFAVGVHEVTFAEWDACVSDGGCGGYRPDDEGWGRGRRPVINVSWDDAQSYVRWLSRTTGKTYRLPSESEWEYAARAGTTTRYWWGDSGGPNLANCRDHCGDTYDYTAPVGSFRANDFGLFDVSGNVWEWVADCWHNDYRGGAPTDGSVWTGSSGCRRVLRGGSWISDPGYLRSADRLGGFAGNRSDDVGFRVAAWQTARGTAPTGYLDGPTAAQQETVFWESIQDSQDAADFESFLGRFPNGRFAPLAGNRLVALRQAAEAERHRQAVAAERQRQEAAGRQVIQDCDQCPVLVVVPAGTFRMGSPSSEEGRDAREGPQRRVTIGAPFAVGVHEVTFAEWDACVSDGGCGGYWPSDLGWGRGRLPVMHVSWNDAQSYVRWLSRTTGKTYRLPSSVSGSARPIGRVSVV